MAILYAPTTSAYIEADRITLSWPEHDYFIQNWREGATQGTVAAEITHVPWIYDSSIWLWNNQNTLCILDKYKDEVRFQLGLEIIGSFPEDLIALLTQPVEMKHG